MGEIYLDDKLLLKSRAISDYERNCRYLDFKKKIVSGKSMKENLYGINWEIRTLSSEGRLIELEMGDSGVNFLDVFFGKSGDVDNYFSHNIKIDGSQSLVYVSFLNVKKVVNELERVGIECFVFNEKENIYSSRNLKKNKFEIFGRKNIEVFL